MTARRRVTGPLIALCWAWSAALAMAEPVTTIRSGGPSANRVDLVILGDGFTADQIASGAYAAQIEVQVQRLFAQEPYLEYAAYFNVHRVDVVSAQSGADHPERGAYVDTALNATYNCSNIQRLICVSTANVNAVLTRSAIPADARDLVLVIVNDAEYGGSGGAVAVASLHAQATELVLHENGHTFAQLADEYNYSPPPCVTTEPTNANATRETRREFIKWRHWIDPGTPVPTGGAVNGMPGLYDGAVYCASGAYRPTYDSKMRSLGRPFEQINTEQHVRRIYNFVSPIDGVSPSTSAATVVLGVPNLFEVAVPSPRTHALLVRWFVNGVLTTTGTRFSSDILPLGTHHVEVSIQDTTGLVRSDPTALLSESRAWDVTVQNGVTAVPTFLTASSIAGNTVTLSWTPPTAFAPTGYVLEGGVSPGQVLASISTGSAAPSFTFTAPTGAFYVRIHALNAAARSGASNEIRIYVNVPQPPGTPTNLLGGAAGSTTVARLAERRWRSAERNRPRRERIDQHVGDAAGDGEFQLCERPAGYLHVQRASRERSGDEPAVHSGDAGVPRHVHAAANAGQPDHGPRWEPGDGDLEPAAERKRTLRLRAVGGRQLHRQLPGYRTDPQRGCWAGDLRAARRGDERVRL